jgi:hypothetical protein
MKKSNFPTGNPSASYGAGKIQKLLLLVVVVSFLTPLSALAICEGPIVPCGRDLNNNGRIDAGEQCQFCHIFTLINNILGFILTCLTPIIAGLMLVLGGIYMLTAGPSPERMSQAKSIITAVVIGLVIIFLAWVFLNTFLDAIGVAEWTGLGTWWKIKCP